VVTQGGGAVLKKVLLVVVVLFLGYWLVQQPDSFAAFAQDGAGWAWKMAQTLFQSIIDVLSSLGH
jgi:hypothetical protein